MPKQPVEPTCVPYRSGGEEAVSWKNQAMDIVVRVKSLVYGFTLVFFAGISIGIAIGLSIK